MNFTKLKKYAYFCIVFNKNNKELIENIDNFLNETIY